MLTDAQLSFQLAQGIEDLDFLHTLLQRAPNPFGLRSLAESSPATYRAGEW